jgi:hypothetical protein
MNKKYKLVFNDDIKLYLGISEVILAFSSFLKTDGYIYLTIENCIIAVNKQIPLNYFSARICQYINSYITINKNEEKISFEESQNIYKYICNNFKNNKLTLDSIYIIENTDIGFKLTMEEFVESPGNKNI